MSVKTINYITAFLAGVSAKLYDDICDNPHVAKYKNDTLLEGLKGVQFMTTVKVALDDPLFMIVYYFGNVANFIGDKNSFKDPYEKSLIYSYLFLFLILDYTKFTRQKWYEYCTIIMFIYGMFLESSIFKSEYSNFKLICRVGSILSMLFLLYIFPNVTITLKYLWLTIIGYFFVSSISQFYSLFIYKGGMLSEKKEEEDVVVAVIEEKKEEEDVVIAVIEEKKPME